MNPGRSFPKIIELVAGEFRQRCPSPKHEFDVETVPDLTAVEECLRFCSSSSARVSAALRSTCLVLKREKAIRGLIVAFFLFSSDFDLQTFGVGAGPNFCQSNVKCLICASVIS
ncbi:MAG: hypothetical protein MZV70_55815 [Desulfobacterales bacterium]|nr:hypothetical protein [Desulfobacterales bacterium]